ncbi:MAG: helix-turn-helix transcriptional regulator [Acidimicrobiales bacterium]
MPKQHIPGPENLDLPADALAINLVKFRTGRKWSQAELAERLAAHDLKWVRSTVAKVEGREREVTVDEACVLAFTLGVPLVALLCHSGVDPQMRITPQVTTSPHYVWWWMAGDYPIGEERFYFAACQDTEAEGERRVPGLQRLRTLVRHAQTLAGTKVLPARDRQTRMVRQLVDIRDSAKEIADRVIREADAPKKKK